MRWSKPPIRGHQLLLRHPLTAVPCLRVRATQRRGCSGGPATRRWSNAAGVTRPSGGRCFALTWPATAAAATGSLGRRRRWGPALRPLRCAVSPATSSVFQFADLWEIVGLFSANRGGAQPWQGPKVGRKTKTFVNYEDTVFLRQDTAFLRQDTAFLRHCLSPLRHCLRHCLSPPRHCPSSWWCRRPSSPDPPGPWRRGDPNDEDDLCTA